jgi:hypothetical protein
MPLNVSEERGLVEDVAVVTWGYERAYKMRNETAGHNDALELHAVVLLVAGICKLLELDWAACPANGAVEETKDRGGGASEAVKDVRVPSQSLG